MRTCTNLQLTGNPEYIKSVFLEYHSKHLANCKCPWIHENIELSPTWPVYHMNYLLKIIDNDKIECLIDFVKLMETTDHMKTFLLDCIFNHTSWSDSTNCIAYFYNGYRAFVHSESSSRTIQAATGTWSVDSEGLDPEIQILESLRQKYTKKEQEYIREVFLDLGNYDRVSTLTDLQCVYSTSSSVIFYGIEHFNDKIMDFKTFCERLTSRILHSGIDRDANEKNIQDSRNRMKIIKRYYTKKIWEHVKDSESNESTLQSYFIKTFFKQLSIVSDLSMYVYYDSSFWRSFYRTHYPELQCPEFARVKQHVDEIEREFQYVSQVIHSGLTGKIPEDVIKYCVVECF